MKDSGFCYYMHFHYYWLPFKIYVRFFLLESKTSVKWPWRTLYRRKWCNIFLKFRCLFVVYEVCFILHCSSIFMQKENRNRLFFFLIHLSRHWSWTFVILIVSKYIEWIFMFSKLKLREKLWSVHTAANHFTSNGQYLYIWNKQMYAERQKERDCG